MKIARRVLALAALACACASSSYGYPDKPIRLVVPYPPGGGGDILARSLAQKLAEALGKQVVVDNRGGAGGNIGMELAANAPPDGYTLVLALTAQLAINPALYSKLPYDPLRDYAAISLLGSAPYLLTVHPALPATSVKELIALARARPNQITFASSGNGSGAHLAAELLDSMAGIRMIHVPYKGGGPALPDLIGGQVNLMFLTYASSGQYVRAGRLRALGVTSAKRSSSLPDLPTIAEAGLPGYDAPVWYGLLASSGTPAAIITQLNGATNRVLALPDMHERFAVDAIEVIGGPPQVLADYMRSELRKWAKVVKESGAKID